MPAEWELLQVFLRTLLTYQSNAGCNDMDLGVTAENAGQLHRLLSLTDVPHTGGDGPSDKKGTLLVHDSSVLWALVERINGRKFRQADQH